MQIDGKVIDNMEMFYSVGTEITVLEVDGETASNYYVAQLEYGNAYYRIMSALKLNELKEVLKGIFFIDV